MKRYKFQGYTFLWEECDVPPGAVEVNPQAPAAGVTLEVKEKTAPKNKLKKPLSNKQRSSK